MIRFYGKNAFVAFVGVVFAALVTYVAITPEELLLRGLVRPLGQTDVTVWSASFVEAQHLIIPVALVLAMAWHIYALLNSGREGDDRILWLVVGALGMLASLVIGFWEVDPAQSGRFWALILSVVNALGAFWLATFFFTPAPHKYDPWGASSTRTKVPF
ncbi:MAG TPA: hypothetical protein VH744_13850 [Terriglobales bacterium]